MAKVIQFPSDVQTPQNPDKLALIRQLFAEAKPQREPVTSAVVERLERVAYRLESLLSTER